MSYSLYTNLQATPDFAIVQFESPTLPQPTVRQVRFNGHQDGRIYHVDFRNRPAGKKDVPSWPESKDFHSTVTTTIQIIEIYSERYPRRILRFNGDTPLKAQVFGAVLTRYQHLLSPLFLIERDAPWQDCPGGNDRSHTFIVRRKPIPYFSVHTVESTWNGISRIFNTNFSIEVDKSIRIGLTVPTI